MSLMRNRPINEQTYIRLSVTLTRFDSNTISFLATLSFLALLISRTTLVSKIGSRSASIKNALTSWAVTSGGRSCRVSTVSNRGPWRLIRSRAGCRKSADLSEVGRRYIRRRVRNMLLVGVPGWYILLQYLKCHVRQISKLKLPKCGADNLLFCFQVVLKAVYV